MAYVKIIYQNSPSTATPINAQNLNHMDDGIAENDRRLNELETAGVVNKFNGRSGNITPTKGDYDIADIGATAGEDGYVPVWRNSGTEQEPNWGFEMEQQGGAGHVLVDSDGNDMPSEDKMQFADAFLTDDDVNGKTVVENIKEVAPADYASTTDEGIIVCDDGEDAVIHPSSEDKVEVTADGNTTRRDLFNWLFNHCDTSKIRENAYIVYSGNGRIYHYEDISNGTYIFAWESIRATTIEKVCLQLNSSTSTEIDWTLATTGNTKEENYSYKPANGYKYTLYYGTSSGIVELNTDARHCMMSDGQSVEDAFAWKYVANVTNHNAISIPTGAREIFCVGSFGNMSVMFPTSVGNARSGYYSSANDNGDIYVAYSNNQLVVSKYLINGADVISQGVRVYYR